MLKVNERQIRCGLSIEKGEYEKAIQIAKNMLDEGLSLKVISKLTDLPIEVVHQLASSKDISLQQ